MKKINTFEQFHSQFNNDFIGQWAQMLGMTREEYVAHYATATIGSGIDEELRPDEEAIPGGASAGGSMSIEDIAKHHGVDLRELIDQYEMGIKVELEHTDDNETAAEIARDHIYEDPKYYDKLKKVEESLLDIVESATVLADRYVRSHNKTPKGWGKWMFSYNKNGDDYFEVPGSMSFTDAVKWVKDKAKEDKKDYVYVMEGSDHEVGMAQGQLEAIHKAAAELQEKIGSEEKDLPGWIQDHISQAYSFLQQANDNFHELEEAEETNEALKMLMDPLMHKVMKAFGFNRDPKIRQELRDEIQVAIEAVLRKHDIVVESTFNDGEIAIYTDTRGDAGETQIWKRGKGYYGRNDSFDFEAKDKKELEMKLKRWGYELIAGSID
jgi:hypothetical protein